MGAPSFKETFLRGFMGTVWRFLETRGALPYLGVLLFGCPTSLGPYRPSLVSATPISSPVFRVH